MALLGNLISRSLRLRNQFEPKVATPETYQQNTLRQLLERARYTSFGKKYDFSKMLDDSLDYMSDFRSTVPVHSYNDMYSQWWHKCQEGEENITWPGKVKYFALSSGTSESASKHIPITQDMLRSINKTGFKQFCSMVNYDIPSKAFQKGVLMLGGTTSLYEKGGYYEGDLSGIGVKNMPKWLSSLLYKPGQKISRQPVWEDRIKMIVEKASQWDVATVCGVPAWVQIVMEEIIRYYNVSTIHDVWPNFSVYIHGGVAFDPYRESFKKLCSKPVTYLETYMASEGFFGFNAHPEGSGIKLVLNEGIFYEFIPFNSDNFDDDGNVRKNPESFLIHEVKENIEYAMMISTCAGTWRYIIGDVIKFNDAAEHEISIVGRTKQFLSLCGEHLSIDNMTKAVDVVAKKLGIEIHEFTVSGQPYENLFAHYWYIACDNENVSSEEVKRLLDETLSELNDDYAVERTSALKDIFVKILPKDVFYEYMRYLGKEGSQNKFPRVLKGAAYTKWVEWLKQNT